MNFLMAFGIGLAVLGLILAFTTQINEEIEDDFLTGAAGCNSTDTSSCGDEVKVTANTTDGLLNVAKKLPTLATIGVAVVIIGLLIGGFARFGGRE